MDFGSLFGGIGDFISGMYTSKGYEASEAYYREAARVTKLQGALKDTAIRRQIFQTEGAATAAAGASGIKLSGSVLDVIKSNTQQGFLTKAVNVMQTNLEYKSYMAQAAQAKAAAKGSFWGGIMGGIGGLLGFFSDDRLKTDIKLIGRRGDGLGIYHYKFDGSDAEYEGVMASEVMVLFPDAVHDKNGYKIVDYDKIGVEFKRIN